MAGNTYKHFIFRKLTLEYSWYFAYDVFSQQTTSRSKFEIRHLAPNGTLVTVSMRSWKPLSESFRIAFRKSYRQQLLNRGDGKKSLVLHIKGRRPMVSVEMCDCAALRSDGPDGALTCQSEQEGRRRGGQREAEEEKKRERICSSEDTHTHTHIP